MKRNMFGALMAFIVACTIVVPAVHAQSSIVTKADVPFAFTVGSNQMPAGAIEVRELGYRATLIQTKDRSAHVLGIYPYAGPNKKGDNKLVFHKVGDRYFLAEIWTTSEDAGLLVPKSAMEKEMTASNYANTGGGPETVIVAMR